MSTFGVRQSGWSAGSGSCSNTSSPAPAISCERSAAVRSSSLVVLPRPRLMKNAVGVIFRKRARCMKPSVAGVCGTVSTTKSARARADDLHAERGGEACRIGADAAETDDPHGCIRQMHDAGVERRLLPLAAQLLGNRDVQTPREGQH